MSLTYSYAVIQLHDGKDRYPFGEDATKRPLASSEPANGCSPCRLLNEYSRP